MPPKLENFRRGRKLCGWDGGCGYSRRDTIERLRRDARVAGIYEGANEIQRLIIARDIFSE